MKKIYRTWLRCTFKDKSKTAHKKLFGVFDSFFKVPFDKLDTLLGQQSYGTEGVNGKSSYIRIYMFEGNVEKDLVKKLQRVDYITYTIEVEAYMR